MKTLWNVVNEFQLGRDGKVRLFIAVMTSISVLAGTAAWGLVGSMCLPDVAWLICFIGYPAIFIGVIGSVIYLNIHEFE